MTPLGSFAGMHHARAVGVVRLHRVRKSLGSTAMTHAAIIVIGLVVAVRAAGFYWTEGVDFHAYWSLDLTHPYDGARSYGPNAFL